MSTDLLVLLALWCYGLFAVMIGWVLGSACRDGAEADQMFLAASESDMAKYPDTPFVHPMRKS